MQQDDSSFLVVIKNRGFLNLWINQILVQLSYNSLNFALIIWVYNLTGSNLAVSALLLAVYLPAVVFGLFAGILVDITDKKKIILAIDGLLCLSFLSLILFKDSFLAILLITFIVNSLAQFYSPSESSAIPIVVKKDQLLIANSLFSITLYSCFLLGFGLAGPLINFLGINMVFGLGGVFLALAFALAFRFPAIVNKADPEGLKLIEALRKKEYSIIPEIGYSEILQTLAIIRGKLSVSSSIMILGGVQAVIGIIAVLVPSFFEKVVQIKATDASYILVMPLGLGMVLGGLSITKVARKIPRRYIVGGAVVIAGLLFFAVGIAPLVSPVIKYFPTPQPLPFFYQPPLSMILAVGSFFLGLAMVSIIVPAQTVLQENTEESHRGKVFSVLSVAMAAFSLLPVVFAGVLSDMFGAMPIFIAMGGIIAMTGLFIIKPDFYFTENHLPFKIREFLGLGHWRKLRQKS